MNDVMKLLTITTVICAWIAYADHPTAQNLRRAVIETMELG